MKGLELSQRYYEAYGREMIECIDPALLARVSVGLCGEGSQCFGFDDQISQDHDFAPGFCVWLSEEDFSRYGRALRDAYDGLPDDFCGFSRKNVIAGERLGVMTSGSFYKRFTGSPEGPQSNMDWLMTPEAHLACAANGRLFHDQNPAFSRTRERLLAFYPEDVRRKKIAARAAVMAQAGQYNLLRLIKREDKVAASLALARFTEASVSMVHLLNQRYTPFYKWSFYSMRTLPKLGGEIAPLLSALVQIPALIGEKSAGALHEEAFQLTEEICIHAAEELRAQALSRTRDSFLQSHAGEIMEGIGDPQLRAMHPMTDCHN
ncbi:hypothetical protein N510_003140 [Firmicutes bacterium ASF500]|nr:hypothetical protein N510_003140 [Firmicutes bacterium ASF500]